MMFLVYLYGSIAIILTVYTVVEKKRLLLYKEANQIKLEKEDMEALHLST